MRGDKSFAYDLLVRPGRVSGRVALLLRSTERKPVAGKICEKFSPHQCTTLCEVLEGDIQPAVCWKFDIFFFSRGVIGMLAT